MKRLDLETYAKEFFHKREQKIRCILDHERSREVICSNFFLLLFKNGNTKTHFMLIRFPWEKGEVMILWERGKEMGRLTLVIERQKLKEQMEVGDKVWVLVLVECLLDDSILSVK